MSTVNLVNDMRSIYNTKIAIKDALGTESDVFADYPGYILDYNTRLSYVEEHKADIEDIPSLDGYATEAYVNTAIAGVSIDLSSYVTKDELSAQSYITMGDVSACGYITQHQDLSDYAQKSYVVDYVNTYAPAPDLSGYVSKSELSACSYITLNDIPSVDLSSYVTKDELSAQSYLTSHQSLNGYATEQYVEDAIDDIVFPSAPDLTPYVTKTELSAQSYLTSIPSEYITQNELSACGYITLNDVPTTDLSGYVSKTELSSLGYITSIPSEYITQTELSSCGYITSADVDLSDFVSYDYADENYVSYSYLGDIEEITEYILGSGSSSAPENIYATKAELNSYVSKTSLQNMSYITESDVAQMGYITMDDIDACGYITASDIPSVVVPVIDENLIPKETNTYTLGDSTHLYNAAYSSNLYLRDNNKIFDNGQYTIGISINSLNRYNIGAGAFSPSRTDIDLGTSSNKWRTTYSYNYYLDNSRIYGESNIMNFEVNGARRMFVGLGGVFPVGDKNLGTSSSQWAYTYTKNLYVDGTNIMDIIGDVETLLSNI